MTAQGRLGFARVLVLLLLMLPGCTRQSPEPTTTATATDLTQNLGAAIDEYLGRAPTLYGRTRAVVVSHRGKLVAERYYDSAVDEHAEVRSVTKSVMATLVGAALREGKLPSLDAKLGDLLPHYRPVMDGRTEEIALRQLLTQTAGYTMNQVDHLDYNRPLVPQLLKSGPANRPGTGFEYQDGGPHLLSAVIAHNTGQSTLDYARQVLFEPLGIETQPAYEGPLVKVSEPSVENIETFGWLRDRDGTYCGSFGLKLTARDMVKLGELYRQNGVYNGHRILDESFVRAATQAQSGDLPNLDYGYLWWITPLATEPAFSAIGLHGQLIAVVPARQLVVTISSRPFDTPSTSPEFPGQLLLVENVILRLLPR